MKVLLSMCLILLSSSFPFEQRQAVALAPNFCSDYPTARAACNSFKELVDHRDSEILDMLRQQCRIGGGKAGRTYACLKDGEDKFLIVAFNMPTEWQKTELGALTGRSTMCMDEYENGIPNGYQHHSVLEWTRADANRGASEAMTPITKELYRGEHIARGETVATVDPGEITMSYSFANKAGGTTDYRLTVRRSTKRFVETWTTAENTETESGHCAGFDGKP